VGLVGDDCSNAPCRAGLACVKDKCVEVPPPPAPTPPCKQNSDCVLNGNADGRVCNSDGTCSFAPCVIDQQCGTRICDSGTCAENNPCASDTDCGAGQVCTNNACRTACQSDAECPALGGVSLSSCVAGRCEQRCLNDQMCLLTGGICDNNLCVPPQCQQDGDCTGPAHYFCQTGRCTQFTPCTTNADCFDPNFECSAQGRCTERPTCAVDADCGAGVCLAQHCQDATQCTSNADCTDANTECLAGKCVATVACRASSDCTTAGDVCDGGKCVTAPTQAAPSSTVVRTSLGACFTQKSGACAVPAFVGDVVSLYAQGFGADGSPANATININTTATHSLDATTGIASVTCDATGTEVVQLNDVEVDVQCARAETGDQLDLVVYDPASGAGVDGAHVILDATGADAGITANGGAFFSTTFAGGDVAVKTDDGRGVLVVDVSAGATKLFLPLPDVSATAPTSAAGFRAQVTGSADQTLGPVGLSLALPAVANASDASLENVVGGPFTSALNIQLLGNIPVTLPASAMMDATLPLAGPQTIKQDAFDTAPAGPQSALCFETRFQQQFIFNVAFAADPTTTALDFVAQAEGMNAKLVGAGVLDEQPLVVDQADINGNGNTTELVPDFNSFAEITAVPSLPPQERVGVVTSAPPQSQSFNARAFAVCGVQLPDGLMPLGVAALTGSPSGSNVGEQVKIVSPPASVAGAQRACTVHAVSSDPATQSFVVVRAPAFAASLDAGALLDPPAGAFVLANVPNTGDHSIVLPTVTGADAIAVGVFDGAVAWTVLAPASGSIALPPFVTPTVLLGTTAYRLDGTLASSVGSAAFRSIDDVADAVSTSP
jgi:hypothetical protein